jgi:hypothetical protein
MLETQPLVLSLESQILLLCDPGQVPVLSGSPVSIDPAEEWPAGREAAPSPSGSEHLCGGVVKDGGLAWCVGLLMGRCVLAWSGSCGGIAGCSSSSALMVLIIKARVP